VALRTLGLVLVRRLLSLAGWRRARHDENRMTWKEFTRRYIVPKKGVVIGETQLFNPATVPVTRYRYRGEHIPTLWEARTPA
jgi:RNA-directed DNA polymerase